jgi:hypothetical protein
MRIWANLSWYELAAVSLVRGTCCDPASLSATDLPPSVGTCPSMSAALDSLAKNARNKKTLDVTLSAFREAALCTARGQELNPNLPSPYDYVGPPGGGAESSFRKILDRALANEDSRVPNF